MNSQSSREGREERRFSFKVAQNLELTSASRPQDYTTGPAECNLLRHDIGGRWSDPDRVKKDGAVAADVE